MNLRSPAALALTLALTLWIPLHSFALKAYFDYSAFYAPGQGSYAEFVLSFDGTSVSYHNLPAGTTQANLALTIIVSQNEQVIDFRKSNVDGPEVASGESPDFMALERFFLPAGTYDLEITVTDMNNPAASPEKLVQEIIIPATSNDLAISDIQFISAYSPTTDVNAFSKSGYDLVPYVSNYFPSAISTLACYFEVYHADLALGAGSAFVIATSVTDAYGASVQNIGRIKRATAAEVSSQLITLDISQLTSGDYFLLVEIRDKSNTTVASAKTKFTRNLVVSTPSSILDSLRLSLSFAGRFQHRDSLYAMIQSMLPIAESGERLTIDNQLLIADLQQMQGFLYQFWYERNPENPEEAWLKYMKNVKAVDKAFGTRIKPGWRTDRGRIYLQYGPPNTRIERPNDPGYYPFEIWHYYETNNDLHNRKFLFSNPSLSGDYELIHSNVYNEVQNADWQQLVHSDFHSSPAEVNRNRYNQPDTYSGDKLEDLWNNPH